MVFFPGQNLPWLNQKRKAALESFSKQGFPSSADEEWRYVNFSAVSKKVFLPKRVEETIEILVFGNILIRLNPHYATACSSNQL